MSDTESLYQHSLQQHRAGQLDAARDGYLEVLRIDPGHARAMHRLGNLDLRTGDLGSAERLIRRALALQPDMAGALNSLGNVLRAQGKPQPALEAYQAELAQRPDFAVAHHQIGQLFMDLGRHDDALQSLQKSIFHAPEFAAAYNTLGRLYNNRGELDEAAQALRRCIHFDGANIEALCNLAHVLRRKGDTSGAIQLLQQALAQNPENAVAHRQLGTLLLEQGESDAAMTHLEQALRIKPDDGLCHYSIGLIYQRRAVYDRAIEFFSNATARLPDYADGWCNLGASQRAVANLEEAAESFRRALALDPSHVAALSGLAGVLEMRGEHALAVELLEPVVSETGAKAELVVVLATALQRLGRQTQAIAKLESALQATRSTFDQMVIHFKLGELLDREGDYQSALHHFETANALCKTDFDPTAHSALVNRITKTFTATAYANLPRASVSTEVPVFIVGLPRSGTTLVEQIISSHAQAAGAGELAMIRLQALALPKLLHTDTPYPECIAETDVPVLDKLAAQYLQRLRKADPNAERITDKMWQNYENLGFVRLLFPEARIIHCRRDPRDSLLSCYFQLFGLGGIPFSYNRDHLLTAFQSYHRLIRHWRDTLAIPMFEIDYEELVAQPETLTRNIIEFTGLPWDANCLQFHRNERGVATASYNQVRQPIYTESVRRHTHYTPWLQDWFDAIDAVT